MANTSRRSRRAFKTNMSPAILIALSPSIARRQRNRENGRRRGERSGKKSNWMRGTADRGGEDREEKARTKRTKKTVRINLRAVIISIFNIPQIAISIAIFFLLLFLRSPLTLLALLRILLQYFAPLVSFRAAHTKHQHCIGDSIYGFAERLERSRRLRFLFISVQTISSTNGFS